MSMNPVQVLRVALQGAVFKSRIGGTFDYLPPKAPEAHQLIGRRVLVPFGKKKCSGFVVGVANEPPVQPLRPIFEVIDEPPLMNAQLLKFLQLMADYYMSDLGEAVATAVPSLSGLRERRRLYLTDFGLKAPLIDVTDERLVEALKQRRSASFETLQKITGVSRSAILALIERGIVEERVENSFDSGTRPKLLSRYRLGTTDITTTRLSLQSRDKVVALCELVRTQPALTRAAIQEQLPKSAYALDRAVELGIIEKYLDTEFREAQRDDAAAAAFAESKAPELTPEQSEVLQQVLKGFGNGFQQHLLHGVTGSGKTEVYMRLTAEALKRGLGTIILVPEIALTPQLLQRMRGRFGNQVAVLHSNLGPGERMDQWRALAAGERRLVIGARSAVFAPLPEIGLIVVDEEHDPSYKQDDHLAYSGRDLAILRAKLANATLLLGSATPDVGTFHRAQQNELSLLRMPSRVAGMQQPQVTMVDMRSEPKRFGRPTLISQQIIDAIRLTLENRESAILFLNRRGFTPVLLCPQCGETPRCRHCAVTLTYHRQGQILLCHYCGFEQQRSSHCPACGCSPLVELGMGTERLEAELNIMFPEARIARMDRDTTQARSSHGKIIRDLQEGKTDILVGTQMVTKGLDVDRVTLVGVLSADLSLHLPDFRACERTFQLVTQVAGRAGRGQRPGYVYIQTFNPEHYALSFSSGEDYLGFFQREIEARRAAHYPPFCKLIALRFQAVEVGDLAAAFSAPEFTAKLQEIAAVVEGEKIGPAPAPIKKLYGKYRWQALIKLPTQIKQSQRLQAKQLLTALRSQLKNQQVELKWDIDPFNFL